MSGEHVDNQSRRRGGSPPVELPPLFAEHFGGG